MSSGGEPQQIESRGNATFSDPGTAATFAGFGDQLKAKGAEFEKRSYFPAEAAADWPTRPDPGRLWRLGAPADRLVQVVPRRPLRPGAPVSPQARAVPPALQSTLRAKARRSETTVKKYPHWSHPRLNHPHRYRVFIAERLGQPVKPPLCPALTTVSPSQSPRRVLRATMAGRSEMSILLGIRPRPAFLPARLL